MRNLNSEAFFGIFFEAPPEFSSLFAHDYSISRREIEDFIHSQILVFKLFFAAPSTVCIYQGPDDVSFAESRVNIVERVILATLESKRSKNYDNYIQVIYLPILHLNMSRPRTSVSCERYVTSEILGEKKKERSIQRPFIGCFQAVKCYFWVSQSKYIYLLGIYHCCTTA